MIGGDHIWAPAGSAKMRSCLRISAARYSPSTETSALNEARCGAETLAQVVYIGGFEHQMPAVFAAQTTERAGGGAEYHQVAILGDFRAFQLETVAAQVGGQDTETGFRAAWVLVLRDDIGDTGKRRVG